MTEHLLVGLASIIVLGVAAQWLAWRLRLPSILLLLIVGFLAGPVTGLVDPDALFGDLLLPLVSLSVAVILFEGGMSLRVAELREIGTVVRNLVTVGALVTCLASAVAARVMLGLDWGLALLLGAILIVTGPTVIGPLLRHVRPSGHVGFIVKWEGILNDPIGAILATLVFEAILSGAGESAMQVAALGVFRAALVGGVIGALGGGAMVVMLRRYWIPDFLQNPLSLMFVLTAFTISNLFQTESGLLAVTVMGVVLANQKTVPIKQILEFKESLSVLLISSLFILLAARLDPNTLASLGPWSVAYLAALVVLVRPAAVAISALGSEHSWRERLFVAWMAPRGIVAAAVASVFALELAKAGNPRAEQLVPITFLVIIGTAGIYGLTAAPVARWLQLAIQNPQGVLIIGAHACARAIATVLHEEKYPVLVVDTDWTNITAARMAGIQTFYASILSDAALDRIEVAGVRRLLALTPNDEINALAALHFGEILDRSEIYQLPPEGEKHEAEPERIPRHLRGRLLFGPKATYTELTARFNAGAVIKVTPLTDHFDFAAFRARHGDDAIPLFLIAENGDLRVFTAEDPPEANPGERLISLVHPVEETRSETPRPRMDRN